jgi:hypothetical protein
LSVKNINMDIMQFMKEERDQREKPTNCMETITAPEKLAVEGAGISGLQVMGVFALCGLLAALGWGGVTSTLIIAARACTTKPPSEAADASTSSRNKLKISRDT